ncbi:MAG: MYG1 family protein [Candidatus Paceibacterota bacterium]
MKNKKLVTHNGSFHADDVFAAATLSLLLEKNGETFEIIRTRDPKIVEEGDYVFDVGGIYDEKTNRFDHHQMSFKEEREEGILYSSFGLVWNKFGTNLCESLKAKEIVERKLVVPIDANDNGFNLVENKYDVSPYFLEYLFYSMRPSWSEDNLNDDQMFFESVKIAKLILSREIIKAKDLILAEEKMIKNYQDSKDKRIIILDKDYFYGNVLNKFKEPLFVIYPRTDKVSWAVRAVRDDSNNFKNRKNLPSAWAGLRDEELQKVTGVEDAIFCHRALFLAVARSKEGAIKLAELALV